MPSMKRSRLRPSDGQSDESRPKRTTTACSNCRKKKIKCNGQDPCINCVNYSCACVYPQKQSSTEGGKSLDLAQAQELKEKVTTLLSNLNSLKTFKGTTTQSESLTKQIESLNILLTKNQENYQNNSAVDDELKSRETGYKPIAKTYRYSEFIKSEKILDPSFGLYSSQSILSSGGKEWLLEQLSKYDKSGQNMLQEKWMKFLKVTYEFLNKVLQDELDLWNSVSSDLEILQLMKTDFHFEQVEKVIMNEDPEELLKYHAVTPKTLLEIAHGLNGATSLADPKYLFLVSFLLRFKKRQTTGDTPLKLSQSTLVKLSIHLVRKSIFSFHDFETLYGCLQLLRVLEFPYVIRFGLNVLGFAVDLAKSMGLNLMEFYVGEDETVSDVKRRVLWELFVMDKAQYLYEGEFIRLSHTDVSTFLPTRIFETMRDIEDFKWDYSSVISYISYFDIEISKIISEIYHDVLGPHAIDKKEAFMKVLKDLAKLSQSIFIELRPGHRIQTDKLDCSPKHKTLLISKVAHFHQFYYLTLNFLLQHAAFVKEFGNLHDNQMLENSFKILEIVFSFESLGINYTNLIIRFSIGSFANLVHFFLDTPKHLQAKRALSYLFRFSSIVYEHGAKKFNTRQWNVMNAVVNVLLSPCIAAIESLESESENQDHQLSVEVTNFGERLEDFHQTMSTYPYRRTNRNRSEMRSSNVMALNNLFDEDVDSNANETEHLLSFDQELWNGSFYSML